MGENMKKLIKIVLVMMNVLLFILSPVFADEAAVQEVEDEFLKLPSAEQYKKAKDDYLSNTYQSGYVNEYQAFKQQINQCITAYLNLSEEEKAGLNEMTENSLKIMVKINEIPNPKEIENEYKTTKDYAAFTLSIKQAKAKCEEIKGLYAALNEEAQTRISNYCELDSYNLIADPVVNDEILITPSENDPYVFKHSSNNRFYRYSIFDKRPLFTLVDTSKYGSTEGKSWKPEGIYDASGNANFMAVYCVDIDTYSNKGTYYKRVNLEESGYFDEEAAAHIRAIVMNSYPFISADEMRAVLDGLDGNRDGKITNRCFDTNKNTFTNETVEVNIDQIDENELITAVQHAIWSYSNYYDSQKKALKQEAYQLQQVSGVKKIESTIYPTLGLNYEEKDYSNLLKDADVNEMSAVSQYLCELLPPIYSGESENQKKVQTIITDIEIKKAVAVNQEKDIFNVYLKVDLQDKLGNSASGSNQDELVLTVYSYDKNEKLLENGKVSLKTGNQSEYWINIIAVSGGKIKVVCEGLQDLPLGAYFYSAKPIALDSGENEINLGRKEAQNFVGVAMGKTRVSAETEFLYEQEAETTSIKLKKVDENGNSLNGAEFTLSLIQSQEPPLKIESKTVSSSGELTFENLVVGNHYEISETQPPTGYEAMEPLGFEVIKQGSEPAFVFDRDVTIKEGALIIPNQKYTELKVIKEWKNDEYRLEYRPASVEVELYKNNQPTGDVQQLSEENEWTYTWNKLSKKDSWSVKEKEVADYTSTMKKEGTLVTITNTLTLDLKANLNIQKTDEKGNPLKNVEFSLYKIEENQIKLIETKKSTEAGQVSFNDLSLGDYFLVEQAPSGYQKMEDLYFSVVDNGREASIRYQKTQILLDGVLQIKNTKIPEKTSLTVVKKWNCHGNKMPDFIYVQLYEGNQAVENQKVKLSAENNWTYTFTDLQKGKNWTVKEVEVPKNYVSDIVIKEGVVEITNTYNKVNTSGNQPLLMLVGVSIGSFVLFVYFMIKKRKLNDAKGE